MWLRASCELTFDIPFPTPFILMLRPRSGAQQWVSREEYTVSPNMPIVECTDIYGNLCQRLVAQPGLFSVRTLAEVRTASYVDVSPGVGIIDVQRLPDAVLLYLLPSRYCESDCFGNMATEITAGHRLGYDQVAAIETWLRNSISYIPGSSSRPLSAIEVNQRQLGVCRDLAHLGIALCRSLSIPARMVVGYLHKLYPMDMHAWFEAYLDGRWYTFDATQTGQKGAYIALGFGRDAADVAIYNQFGQPVFPITQIIQVEEIG